MDRLVLHMRRNSPSVVSASGELDYVNCGRFTEVFADLLADRPEALHLCLSELEFIDSSGLRVLLLAARDAGRAGTTLVITSLTSQLARMLRISGFENMFDVQAVPDAGSPMPASAETSQSCSFHAAASMEACYDVRTKISKLAASTGFGPTAVDDIKLAVGEAVSNAVRHGTCDGDWIQVLCNVDDAELMIALTYSSTEFNPHAVPVPDSESCANGGMGIHFMKLVMDDVQYAFDDGTTTITLKKRRSAAEQDLTSDQSQRQ